MAFTVYIIQSNVDYSFYIGYTSDIEKRIQYHNSGKSRYTSRKMPWKLVYSEEFILKKDALRREKFLKMQRNKQFYQRLINDNE